jgi:hypothetical protein
MTLRKLRIPRVLVALCVAMLLSFTLLVSGCENEELKETEIQEINKILATGTGFEDDPFVRAETLRVLELLADARLDRYARDLVEDSSPMVRVAALRALLATKNKEAERLVLADYNRASEPARLAMIEAAMEYGPESLRRELFERAINSKDLRLRAIAFEEGTLAEVNRAVRDSDQQKLKIELKPKLSKLVDSDDFYIAAASLRKLNELGYGERAEPLLAKFRSEDTPVSDRTHLARILRVAGIEAAKPDFVAIAETTLDDEGKEEKDKKLELPIKRIDERLVRAAVLGAVALGEERFIEAAQGYLRNASQDESIEVLEALARNTSENATVSIKIAMQDARPPVRHQAIDLYGKRADAEAKALINALRQEDPMARRKIANILVARFPKEWSQDLRIQLKAEERKDIVLALLRDVIDREKDRAILEPISEQLNELTKDPKPQRSSTAAYLLLLSDPDNEAYRKSLEETSNVQTRYVFLEHMLRTNPKEGVPIFRRYFYDDLYAMRLISAAGLWRAFRGKGGAIAESGEKPAGDDAKEEKKEEGAEG